MATSESPKLYSDNPPTRKPLIGGQAAHHDRACGDCLGGESSQDTDRVAHRTRPRSRATRRGRSRRARRGSAGGYCARAPCASCGLRKSEGGVLALHAARSEAEPWVLPRHRQAALPHVAALLHGRLLGVAHAEESVAKSGRAREQREDEHGETGDEDDAASADRGRECEHAGGEAEPGPARICRDQAAEHDEPERDEPEPPRAPGRRRGKVASSVRVRIPASVM